MDGARGLPRDGHRNCLGLQGRKIPEPLVPESGRQVEGLRNTVLVVLGSITGNSREGSAAHRGGSGEVSVSR